MPSRRFIVGAALDALEDWPDSFIRFGTRCGLRTEHFSCSGRPPPGWLRSVIDEHFSVYRPRVSNESVQEALVALAKFGKEASKKELASMLKCSPGAAAVQRVLKRRKRATSAELSSLISKLDEASGSEFRRRSSLACRRRDVAVCATAVLLGMSLKEAAMLPVLSMEGMLELAVVNSPAFEALRSIAQRNLTLWRCTAAEIWTTQEVTSFRGVRASSSIERPIYEFFRGVVGEISQQLEPDPYTFFRAGEIPAALDSEATAQTPPRLKT